MTENEATLSRMAHLEIANGVRTKRVALRGQLLSGELTLGAMLLPDVNPALSSMTMEQLIKWLPGYGRVRTRRLLRPMHPNPGILLRDATLRLRNEVVRALDPD